MSRNFVRQSTIVERLRGDIVGNRFPPGSRLPTRTELQKEYQASVMTVQRALEFLKTEGFVKSCGRNGTFVAENPPHLWTYAMPFPHHPSNVSHWVRFWTALSHEASRIQHSTRRRFEHFYDMDAPSKSDYYAKLEAAIANERVAGIIFPVRPFRFEGTPVLEAPGVARVAVMPEPFKGVPCVSLDHNAFIDRALDYFVANNRRKVAAIMVPGHSGAFMQYFQDGIEKRGLLHRPWWLQVVAQAAGEWTANVVRLLMQGNSDERPDALLITDDNLVEHAATGIIQAGLRTPTDLEIVGHCNFPWPASSVLPLKRLGYDAGEVLARCIEVIDLQRKGLPFPPRTVVPPQFEDEVTSVLPALLGAVPTGFVESTT